MELVQIYFLKKNNKVAVISNFLAFFQFFVDKFPLLDPDPGGKMNADPDPQPCFGLRNTGKEGKLGVVLNVLCSEK